MSTGDKIGVALVIIFCIVFFGGCAGLSINEHNQNVQACANDAKILNIEYRWYQGDCQLQTPSGIWLLEHDYLMLAASECVQP